MPVDILMPALSPTMTEGTLARWVKKEGDMVKPGDVIAEIETDKATMEVEAVDEGKIGKIVVPEGTAGVAVNSLIAVLLEDGEDAGAISAAPKKAAPKAETKTEVKAVPVAAAPASSAAPKKSGRIFASPLAKRLAAQQGIDLSNVTGSGPHGRIVKADLAKAPAAAAKPSAPSAPAALPSVNGVTKIPNNSIRKVVARRLLESKQTIPHFYLTVECRIDALLAARQEINDKAKGEYKLSVNDFVIKASAMALKAYPAANVSWTDEAILQYANADVSVAVSTPNGLITPIVKAAQNKGLRAISDEVKDLAKRARDGKLKPEEFQGGTFTVSNLGMYGIKEFGAIINPPQSCILAVGAGEERVYAEKGQVKVGNFMTVTLSVDHRSVDGSVGAEFLSIFKQFIENPVTMLV